jgi:transglutaminase-like putative cysteine protease
MPVISQASEPLIRRRLRFTFVFSNPLSRALERQIFWCYLPVQTTAVQRLCDVQTSAPHRLLDDAQGHTIFELSFDHFPALAQKIVTVTSEVELAAQSRLQDLAQTRPWLGAERFIESDEPRLRALASTLRRSNQRDTVHAIYEWVQLNLIYAGYIPEDLGALQAFLQRRGDCTEYADLVVALARANGIPARMIGGYVTDHDLAPRPQDYHNWAEVYLEGAWRLVDAQKGNWWEPINQYVAFRIYRDAAINPIGSAHRYRLQGDLQVTF